MGRVLGVYSVDANTERHESLCHVGSPKPLAFNLFPLFLFTSWNNTTRRWEDEEF